MTSISVLNIGFIIGSLMIIISISSYFVAKSKNIAPIKAALMGFVFSIVPIVGLVYLLNLISKDKVA